MQFLQNALGNIRKQGAIFPEATGILYHAITQVSGRCCIRPDELLGIMIVMHVHAGITDLPFPDGRRCTLIGHLRLNPGV